MDVRKYVYNKIMPLSLMCGYSSESLNQGIDAYIDDNGFTALVGKMDDSIISKVIDNNLALFLSMPPKSTILYFSNYPLIEHLHIIGNKALAHAENRLKQKAILQTEITAVETEFEQLLQEVCKQPGLYEYLKVSISDTLLDLDYAKGTTQCRSKRLSSKEARL